MADKKAEGESSDGAKKPNPMMFMVIGMVVAFVAAFAVAKTFMGHPTKAAEAPEVGEHVTLDEFLVNLADPSGDRYLKTIISLGLVKGVAAEQYKEEIPQTRDAILMLLTSKKLDDVRSTAGKEKLKDQIKDAVNKAIGKDDVLQVDFQTFATQ